MNKVHKYAKITAAFLFLATVVSFYAPNAPNVPKASAASCSVITYAGTNFTSTMKTHFSTGGIYKNTGVIGSMIINGGPCFVAVGWKDKSSHCTITAYGTYGYYPIANIMSGCVLTAQNGVKPNQIYIAY